MSTNKEILESAFKNNETVSFLSISNLSNAETNVKIVYIQDDDVSNKEFLFETSKGERYTNFENNIKFI
jgi:hypothetical protein